MMKRSISGAIARAIAGSIGVAGLVASLAGCTSPEPHYFMLTPEGDAAPTANTLALAVVPHVVAVRKVGLAAYLDRPDIVEKADGPHLIVSTRDQWAEPLQDMLTRVLTADLAHRLAPTQVVAENGAITVPADTNIQVNISQFGAQGGAADGAVMLHAQAATIRHSDAGDLRQVQSVDLQMPQPGNGSAALARAMSQLLGQLADRIAAQSRP